MRRAQLPANGVVDARVVLLALPENPQSPLVARDGIAVQSDFVLAEFRRVCVTLGVTVVAARKAERPDAVEPAEVRKQQGLVDGVRQGRKMFGALFEVKGTFVQKAGDGVGGNVLVGRKLTRQSRGLNSIQE